MSLISHKIIAALDMQNPAIQEIAMNCVEEIAKFKQPSEKTINRLYAEIAKNQTPETMASCRDAFCNHVKQQVLSSAASAAATATTAMHYSAVTLSTNLEKSFGVDKTASAVATKKKVATPHREIAVASRLCTRTKCMSANLEMNSSMQAFVGDFIDLLEKELVHVTTLVEQHAKLLWEGMQIIQTGQNLASIGYALPLTSDEYDAFYARNSEISKEKHRSREIGKEEEFASANRDSSRIETSSLFRQKFGLDIPPRSLVSRYNFDDFVTHPANLFLERASISANKAVADTLQGARNTTSQPAPVTAAWLTLLEIGEVLERSELSITVDANGLSKGEFHTDPEFQSLHTTFGEETRVCCTGVLSCPGCIAHWKVVCAKTFNYSFYERVSTIIPVELSNKAQAIDPLTLLSALKEHLLVPRKISFPPNAKSEILLSNHVLAEKDARWIYSVAVLFAGKQSSEVKCPPSFTTIQEDPLVSMVLDLEEFWKSYYTNASVTDTILAEQEPSGIETDQPEPQLHDTCKLLQFAQNRKTTLELLAHVNLNDLSALSRACEDAAEQSKNTLRQTYIDVCELADPKPMFTVGCPGIDLLLAAPFGDGSPFTVISNHDASTHLSHSRGGTARGRDIWDLACRHIRGDKNSGMEPQERIQNYRATKTNEVYMERFENIRQCTLYFAHAASCTSQMIRSMQAEGLLSRFQPSVFHMLAMHASGRMCGSTSFDPHSLTKLFASDIAEKDHQEDMVNLSQALFLRLDNGLVDPDFDYDTFLKKIQQLVSHEKQPERLFLFRVAKTSARLAKFANDNHLDYTLNMVCSSQTILKDTSDFGPEMDSVAEKLSNYKLRTEQDHRSRTCFTEVHHAFFGNPPRPVEEIVRTRTNVGRKGESLEWTVIAYQSIRVIEAIRATMCEVTPTKKIVITKVAPEIFENSFYLVDGTTFATNICKAVIAVRNLSINTLQTIGYYNVLHHLAYRASIGRKTLLHLQTGFFHALCIPSLVSKLVIIPSTDPTGPLDRPNCTIRNNKRNISTEGLGHLPDEWVREICLSAERKVREARVVEVSMNDESLTKHVASLCTSPQNLSVFSMSCGHFHWRLDNIMLRSNTSSELAKRISTNDSALYHFYPSILSHPEILEQVLFHFPTFLTNYTTICLGILSSWELHVRVIFAFQLFVQLIEVVVLSHDDHLPIFSHILRAVLYHEDTKIVADEIHRSCSSDSKSVVASPLTHSHASSSPDSLAHLFSPFFNESVSCTFMETEPIPRASIIQKIIVSLLVFRIRPKDVPLRKHFVSVRPLRNLFLTHRPAFTPWLDLIRVALFHNSSTPIGPLCQTVPFPTLTHAYDQAAVQLCHSLSLPLADPNILMLAKWFCYLEHLYWVLSTIIRHYRGLRFDIVARGFALLSHWKDVYAGPRFVFEAKLPAL